MHPLPQQINEARAVVTDPARFAAQPAVIATAWATLKEAQGNPVRFDRLPTPPCATLVRRLNATPTAIEAPLSETLDAARPRITARIVAYLAKGGAA